MTPPAQALDALLRTMRFQLGHAHETADCPNCTAINRYEGGRRESIRSCHECGSDVPRLPYLPWRVYLYRVKLDRTEPDSRTVGNFDLYGAHMRLENGLIPFEAHFDAVVSSGKDVIDEDQFVRAARLALGSALSKKDRQDAASKFGGGRGGFTCTRSQFAVFVGAKKGLEMVGERGRWSSVVIRSGVLSTALPVPASATLPAGFPVWNPPATSGRGVGAATVEERVGAPKGAGGAGGPAVSMGTDATPKSVDVVGTGAPAAGPAAAHTAADVVAGTPRPGVEDDLEVDSLSSEHDDAEDAADSAAAAGPPDRGSQALAAAAGGVVADAAPDMSPPTSPSARRGSGTKALDRAVEGEDFVGRKQLKVSESNESLLRAVMGSFDDNSSGDDAERDSDGGGAAGDSDADVKPPSPITTTEDSGQYEQQHGDRATATTHAHAERSMSGRLSPTLPSAASRNGGASAGSATPRRAGRISPTLPFASADRKGDATAGSATPRRRASKGSLRRSRSGRMRRQRTGSPDGTVGSPTNATLLPKHSASSPSLSAPSPTARMVAPVAPPVAPSATEIGDRAAAGTSSADARAWEPSSQASLTTKQQPRVSTGRAETRARRTSHPKSPRSSVGATDLVEEDKETDAAAGGGGRSRDIHGDDFSCVGGRLDARNCEESLARLPAFVRECCIPVSALRVLVLSGNRLTTDGLESLSLPTIDSLVRLDLSHNELTVLHVGWHDFAPNLVSLDLSHNRISDIPALSAEALQSDGLPPALASLRRLYLSHNELSVLSKSWLLWAYAVTSVDLSNNSLSRVPPLEACRDIASIKLSDNRIRAVTNLEHLASLTELDLSNNTIASAAGLRMLSLNQKLRSLRLSGCPITRLSTHRAQLLHYVPGLEVLDGATVGKGKLQLAREKRQKLDAAKYKPARQRRKAAPSARGNGSAAASTDPTPRPPAAKLGRGPPSPPHAETSSVGPWGNEPGTSYPSSGKKARGARTAPTHAHKVAQLKARAESVGKGPRRKTAPSLPRVALLAMAKQKASAGDDVTEDTPSSVRHPGSRISRSEQLLRAAELAVPKSVAKRPVSILTEQAAFGSRVPTHNLRSPRAAVRGSSAVTSKSHSPERGPLGIISRAPRLMTAERARLREQSRGELSRSFSDSEGTLYSGSSYTYSCDCSESHSGSCQSFSDISSSGDEAPTSRPERNRSRSPRDETTDLAADHGAVLDSDAQGALERLVELARTGKSAKEIAAFARKLQQRGIVSHDGHTVRRTPPRSSPKSRPGDATRRTDKSVPEVASSRRRGAASPGGKSSPKPVRSTKSGAGAPTARAYVQGQRLSQWLAEADERLSTSLTGLEGLLALCVRAGDPRRDTSDVTGAAARKYERRLRGLGVLDEPVPFKFGDSSTATKSEVAAVHSRSRQLLGVHTALCNLLQLIQAQPFDVEALDKYRRHVLASEVGHALARAKSRGSVVADGEDESHVVGAADVGALDSLNRDGDDDHVNDEVFDRRSHDRGLDDSREHVHAHFGDSQTARAHDTARETVRGVQSSAKSTVSAYEEARALSTRTGGSDAGDEAEAAGDEDIAESATHDAPSGAHSTGRDRAVPGGSASTGAAGARSAGVLEGISLTLDVASDEEDDGNDTFNTEWRGKSTAPVAHSDVGSVASSVWSLEAQGSVVSARPHLAAAGVHGHHDDRGDSRRAVARSSRPPAVPIDKSAPAVLEEEASDDSEPTGSQGRATGADDSVVAGDAGLHADGGRAALLTRSALTRLDEVHSEDGPTAASGVAYSAASLSATGQPSEGRSSPTSDGRASPSAPDLAEGTLSPDAAKMVGGGATMPQEDTEVPPDSDSSSSGGIGVSLEGALDDVDSSSDELPMGDDGDAHSDGGSSSSGGIGPSEDVVSPAASAVAQVGSRTGAPKVDEGAGDGGAEHTNPAQGSAGSFDGASQNTSDFEFSDDDHMDNLP